MPKENLSEIKKCMIIGDPVEHSLSPAMHNAAYVDLKIDDEFVFTKKQIKPDELAEMIETVRVEGIRGLTCTSPHKVEVIKYLDDIDLIAKNIGAVNTVVNDDGKLKGYNTDWLGVVKPLEKLIDIENKKVAILGAGGAARAIAYGVAQKGAKLTIFNRDLKKAEDLACELNCAAKSLEKISEVKDFDIIINSTSVGMTPQDEMSLVSKEFINKNQIVFEIVYNPRETKLMREAREQGAEVISGLEMLLYQGVAQFELYTNQKAPVEVMREILMKNI